MSQKTNEHSIKLLKAFTEGSKELSEKAAKRIVKELFTQILDNQGYTINRDSVHS